MHVRSAAAAVAGILLAGLLSNAQMSAPHALPARVLSGDISLKGKISPGIAQDDQRLTLQEAIAAAQRNAKPGSSFTALREIVANADTRRIGDRALEQAQAKKVELYQNGILADLLRSGGFLLAETDPRTNSVVSFHLVTLGRDGAPENLVTGPGTNLVDTQELVKDTTELVEQLYSTPSTEDSSLANRFYGGNFPEADLFQGTLFAIPNSLQKLGANPNEVREAAALYGGYLFWAPRYALSMPAFSASPVAAENAAEDKRDTLKADFLRGNHIDPDLDLDLDNVQSERQLQERIELLTGWISFWKVHSRMKAIQPLSERIFPLLRCRWE